MRQLTSIILPVVGVLYPFIVYFGMEHVSTPVFALVLGALWLVRAPSLIREPGGKWMVAAALAYCVLLAISGESILLRWYPVLISLVLLCVFGGSLTFGPPIIERIARLREPELPPEGVRHTRRVTWVWCGFFVFNAATSTALTLWAPLDWWTLYNGVIAYAIMGVLFVGEWLLRKRLRRSVVGAAAASQPLPRPRLPEIMHESADADGVTLQIRVPPELAHFDGHFPGAPVVPGVLHIGWALELAAPRLGTSVHCGHIEALKFQHLLRPGDIAELTLRHDAATHTLHFRCRHGERAYASGRLRVEKAHD